MHFLSYPPPKLTKTFWEHFWGFHFAGQKKSSGRIFSIFASKHEGISRELQTHFGSSLPASFTEKVLGEISRVVHPKTKRFAVKFRRILEVLCLRVLQQKFWAQFHDLCVQERSCLPWNWDAFWKFSSCEFYSKSSGRNSTICASKNEAVWRDIHTHFESTLPARFTEEVLGDIPRYTCPKMQRFAVEFTRICEAFPF